MRVMETYDYEDKRSLLNNVGLVWIRSVNGNLRLFCDGDEIALPTLKSDNLAVCEKFAKENINFAYNYDSSSRKIIIWEKHTEEYEEISAPAFKEVDTCGMGLYAYNKYAASITAQVPTFKMREAAKIIFCEFMEFKHESH